MLLTCHVDSKGPVSSPARVPSDHFAVLHDGALVPPASHQPHGPHRHLARGPHLQEAQSVTAAHPLPAGSARGTHINHPHQEFKSNSSLQIAAQELHVPTHLLWNLQFLSPQASQFYLNTLFIISFIPRGFKTEKTGGFVLVCLGFWRRSRSFLSARLQHSGSGLMSIDCWDTVETQRKYNNND